MRIVVFGASGFAGGHIGAELRRRGHDVIGVARTAGPVVDRAGDVRDEAFLVAVLGRADAAVIAVRAFDPEAGSNRVIAAIDSVRRARPDLRIGVVGGAGSLRTGSGVVLAETEGFPAAARDEARAQADALRRLRADDSSGDWFYVSPSATFGSLAGVEPIGRYRIGGDELLVDEQGRSAVAGEDFAAAFADELEHPRHHRERFTVGQ